MRYTTLIACILHNKKDKVLPTVHIPMRFIRGVYFTIFYIGLTCLAAATPVDLSDDRDPFDTFTIYWENDVFANTDRNYTNGFKLTWSTPYLSAGNAQTRLPQWSYPVINSLPFVNDPADQRAVSLSLGQNIYTPVDTQERGLIEDDRPYAGYSYVAVGFHSKDGRRQNTWEFDIGVVGPYSGAGQYQNFVHEIIDSPSVKGWDNQIGNELTGEVICESKWKLFQYRRVQGLGFDSHYHLGGRVGNVFTYANTGLEFRLGWNLPNNFGSCPIRAGCETNHAFNDDQSDLSQSNDYTLHLFMGFDGRVVARDIFLDGNTFQDSHNVDKEPLVADIIGGIGWNKGRFSLSYAYVYRTKEFEDQEKPQVFGAITMSFLF